MRVDQEMLDTILNATDKHGNKVSYNSATTGEVFLYLKESSRTFNIGTITVADNLITLTKLENIDQFQRNLFAWSINAALSELCDSFVYLAGNLKFSLDKISMLQHKMEMPWGGVGLDSKIYVPLKYWEVSSEDPKINKRVELLGIEWFILLEQEMNQEYFSQLSRRVNTSRSRTTVYPERAAVFKAFELTQPTDVKVVIIGQDPYHDGSATGLAFGVEPDAIKIPPSLQNIRKELEDDEGFEYLKELEPERLIKLLDALVEEKNRRESENVSG